MNEPPVRRTLAPIPEPYPPETAAILATYPHHKGYLLQLFRVFANSIRFLRKGVLNLLDADSPLSLREREITILRVCANNHCEYEWGVHVAAFAKKANLTDDQAAATRLAPHDDPCWSEKERVLLQAVDQLCRDKRIAPAAYAEFAQRWSLEEQLEILALCGNYHTVSFVANTAGLSPEPFAPRFPEGKRR